MNYTVTVPPNLEARCRKAFGVRLGKPVGQGGQEPATDQEIVDRLTRLLESEVNTGEDQMANREAQSSRQPFKV